MSHGCTVSALKGERALRSRGSSRDGYPMCDAQPGSGDRWIGFRAIGPARSKRGSLLRAAASVSLAPTRPNAKSGKQVIRKEISPSQNVESSRGKGEWSEREKPARSTSLPSGGSGITGSRAFLIRRRSPHTHELGKQYRGTEAEYSSTIV